VAIVFLQVLAYLALVVFVSVLVLKAVRHASMPAHLRWELYPVAHETERPYGGSYLENLDWWTKPRERSLLGEIRFMAKEILFFDIYYRLKRKYWYAVYPFHIGTFLLVGWLVLLLGGALTLSAGIAVSGDSPNLWGAILYYLTLVAGVSGFVIATAGCIGLLVERSFSRDLRLYSTRLDYFNLLFILAILLSGLASWYFFDPGFTTTREFANSLFTFDSQIDIAPATYVSILLVCLFLLYMPFTAMMHYLAKYFTYHGVRWDDAPNLKGSDLRGRLTELLGGTTDWSAPHIQSGRKWEEVASGVADAGKIEVK